MKRIKRPRVVEPSWLLDRATTQEQTALLAADLAREADALGVTDTADNMWAVARRCRVSAIKLRAEAGAHNC